MCFRVFYGFYFLYFVVGVGVWSSFWESPHGKMGLPSIPVRRDWGNTDVNNIESLWTVSVVKHLISFNVQNMRERENCCVFMYQRNKR